jgi:hypothetical protein
VEDAPLVERLPVRQEKDFNMAHVREPDDPARCKGSCGSEQCWNRAVTGSDFCEAHNGIDKGPANNMRSYLLAQAEDQAKLAQYAESENIKSLRDEIALARIMVERYWNMVKTDNDFIARAPSINSLLLTIERLIKSSHSIEQSLQTLLGRPAVIAFAQLLVQAVMDELESIPNYEPIADRILKRVMATVSADAAKTMILPAISYDTES